ncbi:MAG: terminase [Vicinamibacteria bacterium]
MARKLQGISTPRISTPPLRRLTKRTSHGFEVIEFAQALGVDLMPWQETAFKRGLEIRPDGTYRFSVVMLLVARQNGKTTLLKVLALWRMVKERSLILGTSTNLEYAREAWLASVELAQDELQQHNPVAKYGALDTSLTLDNKSRYKVAAATRKGGRSLSVDLGIADELREHRAEGQRDGWEAWAALSGATTARPYSQIWAMSNAGDSSSVVLNHFRSSAISYIETGIGDESLGLLEWSAPEGADIMDREAWRQANPSLGVTITERTLESKAGSLPPNVFRVEHMCQYVPAIDGAVDSGAWEATADKQLRIPDGVKSRVALALDVAPDGEHTSLVAAGLADDGRIFLEALGGWSSVEDARLALPDWLDRIKPKAVGWFPSGPAAALGPDLRALDKSHSLTGQDVSEACQSFAALVASRRIVHPDDPLLNDHVTGAAKLRSGDGWRFTRSGQGHVDAAYAAAGAVHLALTVEDPPDEYDLLASIG